MCSCTPELAKVSFNSRLQLLCLLHVGADDQNRVVACDRAYNLGPVFVVDTGGDRLSAAGGCNQDQQIHRLPHFQAKALKHFTNSRQGIIFVDPFRCESEYPSGPFDNLQLMNVARERCLCNMETTPRKFSP